MAINTIFASTLLCKNDHELQFQLPSELCILEMCTNCINGQFGI